MHELTITLTVVGLVFAAATVVYYLALELVAAFWSCLPAVDLPDAEGEALPPSPYTTGALRLVDLAGADAAGIEPRGCWATVSRRDGLVDCGQDTVDVRGVCRVHAEVLEAIEEAGA